MAGRVGVHLERVGRLFVLRWLQQRRTQRHDEVVRGCGVLDPQVEVYLLLRAMRPLRSNVIRCELNADPRRTVHVHHMPVVLRFDCASQHSRPEAAFLAEVSSVEHDDLIPTTRGSRTLRPQAVPQSE